MQTAILIVSFNGEAYIAACLESLRRAGTAASGAEVILVDNASSDATLDIVRQGFPEVQVIALPENRGFCGGNNAGLEYILEGGYDYVLLLNQDTQVAEDFLPPLLESMQAHPQAGQVQPLIMQHGAPHLINTTGNPIHILGFGYVRHCGQPIEQFPAYQAGAVEEIASASGAAVLIRVSALRQVGLFDDLYFAYDEDVDLSWRLRLAGYSIWLDSRARIYHHYHFNRNPRKYYYLERNRLMTVLKNYKASSLLLLAPVFSGYELFIWAYALVNGWLPFKWRSYRDLFANRKAIREKRRKIQMLRQVAESEIARHLTAELVFDELQSRTVRYANGLLSVYWRLVKKMV
jgi:GT2 family glycosyltransferase